MKSPYDRPFLLYCRSPRPELDVTKLLPFKPSLLMETLVVIGGSVTAMTSSALTIWLTVLKNLLCAEKGTPEASAGILMFCLSQLLLSMLWIMACTVDVIVRRSARTFHLS